MPKTRQQKENTVQDFSKKLAEAKAVVFADFKGMTMAQLSDLRNRLHDQQATLSITKNTLLEISLKASGKGDLKLEGPTATLLAFDDEILPLKALVKAIKDNGIGKIKSGFLGNQLLDEFKVIQLAALPAKDELRAKTVGVLAAPLQGIVGVLQGNLRNLVYALSEIQKQRGGV